MKLLLKSHRQFFESLEARQLLSAVAPTVLSLNTDNRGQATIAFSEAINTATLTSASVLEYTAGRDGVFGTSDDVVVPVTFSYSRGTLTVTGAVRANTRYRFVLLDTIKGTNGLALNGTGGRRGGNFDITTSTTTLTAQFTTIAGTLDVDLVDNDTLAQTITNFELYANAGDWDNTFIQRNGEYDSAPDGPLPIVQGGEYNISRNTVETIRTAPAINEVTGLSNTLGTIAMARTSSLTSSESDQWFFNTQDDTSLDAGQYTAFGTVVTRDLSVLAKLAAYPQIESGDDLPVVSPAAVAARGGTLDPNVDLVRITRVAMLTDFTLTSAAAPDLVRVGSPASPDVETNQIDLNETAVNALPEEKFNGASNGVFSDVALNDSLLASVGSVLA